MKHEAHDNTLYEMQYVGKRSMQFQKNSYAHTRSI